MPEITLGELAKRLNAHLVNADPSRTVSKLASLSEAGPGDLSFLANRAYQDQLAVTAAEAVIVGKGTATDIALLVVDNPDLAFAQAASFVYPAPPRPQCGIHPSACIGDSVKLGRNISIGAYAVIEDNAVVGDNCCIYAHVYIGAESVLGDSCLVYPGATIYHQVTIGNRCIIHAGAVVGSDGFGYAWTGAGYYKIPQLGTVVIEDDVEIGANTAIDRARFGETRIGTGTKLDNLVQIAHNVKLGKACAFAAQVGIAGSAAIGNGVQMGGQAAVVGHVQVGDQITIVGQSAVSKNLPGVESGAGKDMLVWINSPAKPMREQLREWQNLKTLGTLRKTVKELEDRIAQLEENTNGG